VTKAESGVIFVLLAVLLIVGLAHFLPAHPHLTSWRNPFGGF